ncbi:MAG TPA: hypothetical protein VFO76_10905 [Candidatus Kapabacteria bacterium]|nr:hypothetical protein [Candidatus Kapabacteria bacterium]
MKSIRLYIVLLLQSLALIGYGGSLINCELLLDNCSGEQHHDATTGEHHADACDCLSCVCHTPAIETALLPIPYLSESSVLTVHPTSDLLSAPTDPPFRPPLFS